MSRGPRGQRRAKRRTKKKRKPIPVPIVDARIMADKTLVDIERMCAKDGRPITCPTDEKAIGCNGCCRGAVIVLPVELRTIVRALDGEGWKRIDDQADAITAKPRQAPCPLLDPETGGCTVYEIRPLACRLYAVVSPVSDCFPERVPGATVATPAPCITAVDAIAVKVLGTNDATDVLTQTTILSTALVEERRRRLAKKAAKRAKRGKAPVR